MPTFYDRFVECAERWPNLTALEIQRHDHLESCTYSELRGMAESVGRWISERGFARGSRLAIVADNHPRWVAAYLGITSSGCAAGNRAGRTSESCIKQLSVVSYWLLEVRGGSKGAAFPFFPNVAPDVAFCRR